MDVVSTLRRSEESKEVLCQGLLCQEVMHPCHAMRRETHLQTILRTVLDDIPGHSSIEDHRDDSIGQVKSEAYQLEYHNGLRR